MGSDSVCATSCHCCTASGSVLGFQTKEDRMVQTKTSRKF
jgi:hypothetical protein